MLLAWRLLLHSQTMVLTAQHIDHLPVPAPIFPQRAPLMFQYSVLLHFPLLEPQTEHITFSLKPTLGSLFTPLEGAPFPLPCIPSSASPLFWSVIQPVDSPCGISSSLVLSPLLLLSGGIFLICPPHFERGASDRPCYFMPLHLYINCSLCQGIPFLSLTAWEIHNYLSKLCSEIWKALLIFSLCSCY